MVDFPNYKSTSNSELKQLLFYGSYYATSSWSNLLIFLSNDELKKTQFRSHKFVSYTNIL